MSVIYDTLTGDSGHTINYTYNAGSTSLYADSNTVGIMGPLYLPRVYGSNLTAFEICSSGKVSIALNDAHSLDFTKSNYVNSANFQNTIDSSNNSLSLMANYGQLKYQLDAFSNNINQYAGSNISLSTGTGNISMTAASNFLFNGSNSFLVSVMSNIFFNTGSGSYGYTANNGAMFMTSCNTTNNITTFASNNLIESASNSIVTNANSNINIGALNGDYKVYSSGSNMFTNMLSATNITSNYSSNNYTILTSNQFNVSAQSNVGITAQSGDLKLFANGSNMRLTMCNSTQNVKLFATSNMALDTCNNLYMSIQSNMNVNTSAGDININANSSNVYLQMSASNASNLSPRNDMSLYASSNIFVTSSNQFILNANSNVSISTNNQYNVNSMSNLSLGTSNGDLTLYGNASNMYYTMTASTNVTSNYSLNNYSILTSNNLALNAKTNINMVSLQGSIAEFAQCNYSVLASNSYSLNTQSNIFINAQAGSLTLNSGSNISILSSNSIFNMASSNYYITAAKNISLNASNGGEIMLSANCNSMFINMRQLSNNMIQYAQNNLYIITSNSINTNVCSNISFYNQAGSFNVQANGSNMALLMDNSTNNTTMYTCNNFLVLSSNNYTVNTTSNFNITAQSGDLKLCQGSNMRITMCNTTQKIKMFSSNDTQFDSSNNFYISSLSNLSIGALSGSFQAYSTGSNMFLTMTQATSNVFLYGCNNLEISASNNLIHNALSNISLNASKGCVAIYANNSNMSLIFSNINNTISINTSNNYTMNIGNNISATAGSNISFTSLSNDFNVYARSNIKMVADNSNIYINMNVSSNPDTIDIYGLSNINMYTSNSMNFNATQNYAVNSYNQNFTAARNIIMSACNNVTIATNELDFNVGSIKMNTLTDQNYTAPSNINFFITSTNQVTQGSNNPIFSVGQGMVEVNGDMLISGNINTSNIYSTNVIQQTLKISDKTINLASFGSNDLITGGQPDGYSTNNLSGIEVDGLPGLMTGCNYNSNNSYLIPSYQKSLLWNYNGGGVTDTGTSNVGTEAYWEMLGGSFHITKKRILPPATGSANSNLADVSFIFRVNELDELELCKRFPDPKQIAAGCNIIASSYILKRISRFGRIL